MPAITAPRLPAVPALDGIPRRASDFRLVVAGTPDREPTEGGEGWICWHEAGFYLGARMEDSEVVAGCDRDEEFHFLHGDTLELFLKPAGRLHYWEMYATPQGRKSTLLFRAPRGEPQPDPLTAHDFRALRVASRPIRGGWETEMWIPAEQLASMGGGWGARSEWTLFVGRYNHGARFPSPELTVFPPISAVNFHLTAEYARIDFQECRAARASEIAGRRRL